MIDLDHAAKQITGVWKMVWNRPDWRDSLDLSIDGVFRSFWAMLIAAPFSLLGLISLRRASAFIPDAPPASGLETPLAFALTVHVVGYLADWAASLAALIFVGRLVGASRRAADIVVGYNWLQPPIAVAQSLPLIALSLPWGREAAGLVLLPALAFVITLYWGFVRRAFGAGVGPAIGIIVLLVAVGLAVGAIITSVAGLFL